MEINHLGSISHRFQITTNIISTLSVNVLLAQSQPRLKPELFFMIAINITNQLGPIHLTLLEDGVARGSLVIQAGLGKLISY